MASNEEVLLQFSAQDDISSVVEAMESSISASFDAISSAMDAVDVGLSNLATTAETVSSSFDSLGESITGAEGNVTSFQSSIDNVDGSNVNEVASSFDAMGESISGAESQLGELSTGIEELQGTEISVNVSADLSGGSGGLDYDQELGGELTQQDTSALRTNMYEDLVGMSDKIAGIGTQAVESASAAEQGWMQLGNAIDNNGGNWEAQEESIKSWVKTYSDSMGRGVADTRTAMLSFMNMGMSLEDTQKTMKVVSNYASQFGMSQSEASKSIQMAFMGAGRSVKKLGLDIADFKDEAGNVDREKLLNAIMEKTSGSAEKYANTYEARVQRMNNAINSLRTDFGKEIINTIEPLLPVVQNLFKAFTGLPQPVKSIMLGLGGLAGAVAIVSGPLLKFKAYMNMANVDTKSLRTGIGALKTGFKALSSGEGISGATSAMKNFITASKAGEAGSDVAKISGVGKKTGTVAKEAGQTVSGASKAGALSGPANTAGANMKATNVGLRSIGQGALSMVAPLLEIAIAVAILLPVLAGLAAEALLLLKGLQLLIDALDFDKVDLTGAIEGIKQIGRALFEMGVAMASMAFANVTTGLAVLTSGLFGLLNPVQVAGQMLVQAGRELQVFNTVKIDDTVPQNLKKISEALKLVSNAMRDLVSVVLGMAFGNIATLGGLLGNVTDAVRTARQEITNAANEIATLKSLPNLDAGAIEKLKKVSSALQSVAKAMDALRSLRDGQNWDSLVSGLMQGIFGGVDIQGALRGIKNDIYKVARELVIFKDMPSVPQGVGNKLQKVSSALDSLAKSVEAMKKIKDQYNWDNGWLGGLFQNWDIVGAIRGIKNDIFKVSAELRTLKGMANVPDGVGEKLDKVSSTLKKVTGAIDQMKKLAEKGSKEGTGGVNFNSLVTTIQSARVALYRVSAHLRSLQGISAIPDGVSEKIKKVSSTTKTVVGAIDQMNKLKATGLNASELISVIQSARTTIFQVSNQLRALKDMANIPEGTVEKIRAVTKATRQLASAVNVLKTFPTVSGNEIPLRVQKAVTVVSNVSRHLNNLSGTPKVGEGITAKISSIGKGGRALRNAINPLKSFPVVSGDEIPNRVKKAVTAVKATAKQLNALKGTKGVTGINQILSSVSSAVKKLRSTLNATRGGFRSSGVGIGNSLKAGIKQSLNALGGVVSGQVRSASGKGRAMGGTGGRGIGTAMVNGFKSTFKVSSVVNAEMTYSLQAIQNNQAGLVGAIGNLAQQMVDEAKTKFDQQSPGKIARMMGAEMDYGTQLINSRGAHTVSATRNMAQRIVGAFNPKLNNPLASMNNSLNLNRLNAVKNMNNSSKMGKRQRPVNIQIGEGAVQLDARNMTTTESRQIMINALDGLDVVDGIDIRGA